MNYYILIIAIIVGYFIAKFFSGKKEGKEGIFKSIKLNIGKYTIHLHHWLLVLILLIILLLIRFYNNLLYGLLIGIMIQGLFYKDFDKIIYRKSLLRNLVLRIKNFLNI